MLSILFIVFIAFEGFPFLPPGGASNTLDEWWTPSCLEPTAWACGKEHGSPWWWLKMEIAEQCTVKWVVACGERQKHGFFLERFLKGERDRGARKRRFLVRSFSSNGKARGVLGRSGCCTYKDEILFNLGVRKLSGGGTAQHF